MGPSIARKLGDTEEITEVTFGWNQIDYSNNNNTGDWRGMEIITPQLADNNKTGGIFGNIGYHLLIFWSLCWDGGEQLYWYD